MNLLVYTSYFTYTLLRVVVGNSERVIPKLSLAIDCLIVELIVLFFIDDIWFATLLRDRGPLKEPLSVNL